MLTPVHATFLSTISADEISFYAGPSNKGRGPIVLIKVFQMKEHGPKVQTVPTGDDTTIIILVRPSIFNPFTFS